MRHAARVPFYLFIQSRPFVAAAGVLLRVQVVGSGCDAGTLFFEGPCFCYFGNISVI